MDNRSHPPRETVRAGYLLGPRSDRRQTPQPGWPERRYRAPRDRCWTATEPRWGQRSPAAGPAPPAPGQRQVQTPAQEVVARTVTPPRNMPRSGAHVRHFHRQRDATLREEVSGLWHWMLQPEISRFICRILARKLISIVRQPVPIAASRCYLIQMLR
jgi:hypothetical protein